MRTRTRPKTHILDNICATTVLQHYDGTTTGQRRHYSASSVLHLYYICTASVLHLHKICTTSAKNSPTLQYCTTLLRYNSSTIQHAACKHKYLTTSVLQQNCSTTMELQQANVTSTAHHLYYICIASALYLQYVCTTPVPQHVKNHFLVRRYSCTTKCNFLVLYLRGGAHRRAPNTNY